MGCRSSCNWRWVPTSCGTAAGWSLAALLPPWLYLSAADYLAIGAGTWTIDPAQTTGILLGGVLPIEEVVFFLLTNVLIVFGMVLLLGMDKSAAKRSNRSAAPEPAGIRMSFEVLE